MKRLASALVCGALIASVGSIAHAERVIGTFADDVIDGTPGPDLLNGRVGDDTIRGAGGNDVLLGKGGNDRIRGGAGRDRIIGGAGHDDLRGGPGGDRIYGWRGNDRIVGGPGSDVLFGHGGRDVINAVDRRQDTVHCGSGVDVVYADTRDRVHRSCESVKIIGADPPPSKPSPPPPSPGPSGGGTPGDIYNCGDFPLSDGTTATEYLQRYPSDPSNLDGDGDGRACE